LGESAVLTQAGCQARQDRLQALLERRGLDAAVFTDQNEIYYFTGFLIQDWLQFPTVFLFDSSGRSLFVSQTDVEDACATERLTYQPHTLFTRNADVLRQAADLLRTQTTIGRAARIGYQQESLPKTIGDAISQSLHPDEWIAIDDDIAHLERSKDPDEIELIRTSIACTLAAYDSAQMTIAPRVSELVVLTHAQRSAKLRAGEQVFHYGDYRAGEFGGPARDQLISEDTLYVIDAWTHYRGYWSDLCRTFQIGDPTELQCEVYEHMAEILTDVEGQLRPGVHGTDIWTWVDRRIRQHPHLRDVGLPHHAGHGVGLRCHEGPDLNRDRGSELRPGDVVSVEPGSYTEELRPGFRLENMFLITETGCELLSNYPLSLDRQI
jgi:Xaa-Pro aminopeptidase